MAKQEAPENHRTKGQQQSHHIVTLGTIESKNMTEECPSVHLFHEPRWWISVESLTRAASSALKSPSLREICLIFDSH